MQTNTKPIMAIEMWNGGTIRIELDPEAAPITVGVVTDLVNQDFYSGLKFHRVVPGFMIQGGDPLGTGDGETDEYVKGEFGANGWPNPISFGRGVIAMARQEGYDTASCQFFITLKSAPSLNGQYTAFGRVIEGMEVVDQVAKIPVDEGNFPHPPAIMRRVYME